MSTPIRLLAAVTLAATIGACVPAAVPPAAVPAVPAGDGASPAPVGQSLVGSAMLGDRPYAGAEVILTRAGQSQALARAVTDAEGRFSIPLPADLPAGALVAVTARGDAAVLAAVAAPTSTAGTWRVLGYPEVSLSLATTLAYISLAPAFDVHASVGGASEPTAIAAAFARLVTAAQSALDRAEPAVREAVQTALRSDGAVALPAAAARALTAHDQAFSAAFGEAARAIADSVHRAVEAGAARPADGPSLTFGEVHDPFLSGPTGGSASASSGSSGGVNPPRLGQVAGGVVVHDAVEPDITATPVVETTHSSF